MPAIPVRTQTVGELTEEVAAVPVIRTGMWAALQEGGLTAAQASCVVDRVLPDLRWTSSTILTRSTRRWCGSSSPTPSSPASEAGFPSRPGWLRETRARITTRACEHRGPQRRVLRWCIPVSRPSPSGSGHDRDGLGELVDGIAADVGLSGVIRVDLDGSLAVQRAYGLAHRGLGVPNDGRHAVRRSPAARRASPRWR